MSAAITILEDQLDDVRKQVQNARSEITTISDRLKASEQVIKSLLDTEEQLEFAIRKLRE